VDRCSYWFVAADQRQVLYHAVRAPDDGEKRLTFELWALDLPSGETRLLHAAPRIWLAPEGSLSPDRREVAFLAGPKHEPELHVLRLADLLVQEPETEFDFVPITNVRWRSDGKLLLAEEPYHAGENREALALWALAPGEKRPACLYRKDKGVERVNFSPDGRWALVWVDERTELVDLIAGKSRRVEPRPDTPSAADAPWSPDGRAYAWVAREHGQDSLMLLDATTGEVSRVYTAPDGRLFGVALSCGARYAACVVAGNVAARLRIIDVATGRATTLRRAISLFATMMRQTFWSPVEATLAITYREKPAHPDWPTRIHFFDFK
jgi:hypothetical protein